MDKVKSNDLININIDDCIFEIRLSDSDIEDGIVSRKTNNKGKTVYKMKDGTYRITQIKPPTFKD